MRNKNRENILNSGDDEDEITDAIVSETSQVIFEGNVLSSSSLHLALLNIQEVGLEFEIEKKIYFCQRLNDYK